MALLYFDGFETWRTSGPIAQMDASKMPNMSSIDAAEGTGAYLYIGTDYARYGSCGLRLKQNVNSYWSRIYYNLAANHKTLIVGVAVKRLGGTPQARSDITMMTFLDGGTQQVRFSVVGSEIVAYDGAGSVLGSSSGAAIDYNTWRYIEFKVTIDNSAGAIIVRSNESVVLELSGIDTQNTANAYANVIRIAALYAGLTDPAETYYDDLYICNDSGDTCNDFLGDIRIDRLTPSGAGSNADFTPSAGSNYPNVDDAPGHDEDSTYNQSGTVGHKDSYALSDLPTPPAGTPIYGVKVVTVARKTDAGAKETKSLLIAGSTEKLGQAQNLSESYMTFGDLYPLNPDDSEAWTDADINALEAGIEVAA